MSAAADTAPRKRTGRAGPARILYHAVMLLISAVFLLPFYWMINSALKTNSAIFSTRTQWWPADPQWSNLWKTINYPDFPFFAQLGNSVFYAGVAAIATCMSCSLAGYSFGCLRWRYRDAAFAVTIAALLIPPIVTLLPTYLFWAKLGLTGTYVPLLAPYFLGDAFFIFMLRQFFLGVPRELLDAARMDGAGEFRIFWQIALPLILPALTVVAIFQTVYIWQEFMLPMIYLRDRSSFPLSVGLFSFRAQRTTEWSLVMMGSLLTTLPLIVLFFFTQRKFQQGIAASGIK
ncbi:MAG: carbohydrate ABC transporter permease [Rhizobiales bacterium]|nr:carbohydrate ABC transporter permease [Hyphomicrobiales bacterium]